MKLHVNILGKGMAGKAAARALYAIQVAHPELEIEAIDFLKRDASLKVERKADSLHVLVICSPHATHAPAMLAGIAGGYDKIVVEKPVCTSLQEVEELSKIATPIAVLHGYRQSWGFGQLSNFLASGELGTIIAVEGRYWQANVAARALKGVTRESWKSDSNLAGPLDVLLDLGTHWTDLVFCLLGSQPLHSTSQLLSVHPEWVGQDTHVRIEHRYANGAYAYASLSKIAHGSSNYLELNVLGTKGAALWTNATPDQLTVSHGSHSSVLRREVAMRGSSLPPFHAMGWTEGYAEILYEVLSEAQGRPHSPYPTLSESLQVVANLLHTNVSAATYIK